MSIAPQITKSHKEQENLMDTPTLLELDSQLAELMRAQTWVEELSDFYGLADETRFAVQLCMEEALANVVLHGYRSEPGHPIVIRSWASDRVLYFAIEDKAPPFTPSAPVPTNGDVPANLESITPGGNGIRLLHRFAGSLAYERLSDGNRLTLGFATPGSKGVSLLP
jgi:serine/threonine-protein kinase RsbW